MSFAFLTLTVVAVLVAAGVVVWLILGRRSPGAPERGVTTGSPATGRHPVPSGADVSAGDRARLRAAGERLTELAARREAAFEELKAKYGGAAKDPNLWMRHMNEIGPQVMAAVPDDPWPGLRADFDVLADQFLAAGPAARDAMSRALWEIRSLQDGHLGYVHHIMKSLAQTPDALALRRAVAIAAMGRGGRDSRDTSLTLADLAKAACAAGLDARAEFVRVAELAAPGGSWGGSSASPREALRAVGSSR